MTSISTVYAFEMPKFVYIQIAGIDKPARIRGDKVEMATTGRIIVRNGENQVAEFMPGVAHGWWIADEPEESPK